MRALVVVLGLAACAQGGGKQQQRPIDAHDLPLDGPADASAIDAPAIDARVAGIDARGCPTPMASGPHLLLSEVTLGPTGKEFIEVVNPTASSVDLSNYYLSDSSVYYKLPTGVPSVGVADFIVRFPAGSSIAAHSVVTVATDTATNFMTGYGSMPTYSIADQTMHVVTTNGTPTLTDMGEMIALFYWDGTTQLVFDVDLMTAGQPTAANSFVSKSGYTQLGCGYATDANTLANQSAIPAPGKSTKRVALESTHETQTGGGNGLTGDDETSEATGTTWDSTFTNPTPGTVPSAIM